MDGVPRLLSLVPVVVLLACGPNGGGFGCAARGGADDGRVVASRPSIPELRLAFPPPRAGGLRLRSLSTLTRMDDSPALHGASGLARASDGRLFVVSDRPTDQGRNVLTASPAPPTATSPWAFTPLRVTGEPACTTNLEAIGLGQDGRVWLASDTARVGRGRLERDAGGRPVGLDVTCSDPVPAGLFPRTDDNAGFEALMFIAGQPHVLTEKAVDERGGASRHRLFRVAWPALSPVVDVVFDGGAGQRIRITEAAACGGQGHFLGTYGDGSERAYFLLSLQLAGAMPSAPVLRRLDNPPLADAGPPNLEGMVVDPDCGALVFINDDSSGDRTYFPETLLRRLELP